MPSDTTPNILWILTDQQPVSTIGAYGNRTIRTPHIDRLACEGALFDRAYVAAFPCSPSRASLLTGLYAHRHGVVTNDVLFDESTASLGNICAASGYATGYFGKWHLGGSMQRHGDGWYLKRVPNDTQFAFEQVDGGTGEDAACSGFDEWVGGWLQYRAYLREQGFGKEVDENPSLGAHSILQSGPDSEHCVSQIPAEYHVEAFIAKCAERFIRNSAKSGTQPFAAVVSFYGPHLPVAPPRPWDEMYPLEAVPEPVGIGEDLSGKPSRQLDARRMHAGGWTVEQYVDYVRRYRGFVSYIDEQIGRVLRALDESGQADNTIVVFSSDHGDMLGEHGLIYKLTGAVYDALMRAPLILRYPSKLAASTSCPQLVSNVDVLPSVLELAGLEVPPGIDGRSFLPAVGDSGVAHRDRVFADVMDKGIMVCDAQWKYGFHWTLDGADELYDLCADPHEERNLSAEPAHAQRVTQMRRYIVEWLRETGHPYAQPISELVLAGQ